MSSRKILWNTYVNVHELHKNTQNDQDTFKVRVQVLHFYSLTKNLSSKFYILGTE